MRVGAISCVKESTKTIEFFGYGECVGKEVPETAEGMLSIALKMLKIPNPKIVLDNGDIVWGCECWWNEEEKTKKFIEEALQKGFKLITVNVNDIRKELKELMDNHGNKRKNL